MREEVLMADEELIIPDSTGEAEEDIFDKTLRAIEENKLNKEKGIYNSIPFGLPSLDKHLPGVMKGMQYLVTASSGVGKTQLTKFLFINQPYKFIKAHPELELKLKILCFALEESKEEFMLGLISHRLKEVYNIGIGVLELRSLGNYTLSTEVLLKIKECRDYFKELGQSLEIIDTISNPFGIYKYVRNYAKNNGTFHYKEIVIEGKVEKVFDHYEANDPKEFVVVIIDHMSLLQPESTPDTNTLHLAMTKMSAEYCRKMITKHFKYCAALVQQQAAEKEKQQYTMSGGSIESKLEPSLDGLGDNKLTQRDALIVLGLFAPERYEIERHLDYDIKILRDNYRSITILKNRIGTPNLKKGFFFNGQTNTFAELPPAKSEEMKLIYEKIKNSRLRQQS